MKGFLKFVALVLLLVPGWIAFLSMTGEAKQKQQANAGPLVAVDQAVRGAWNGGWVWGATGMYPQPSPDAWKVEGLATAPAQAETADAPGAVAFTAAMRSTCLPLSDAACWVVDRLDVPSAGALSAEAAAQDKARDSVSGERLLIVQEQLRSLDLDPGPSDGVFGLQTRQAIEAYIDRAGGSENDDPTAQALVELEALGRLARGSRHHADGNYHAALREYAKVLELDPDNARAHFNRGLAYQEMGVLDLAIKEYGVTLDNEDSYVMAYHSRGNARFDTGDYWRAFADHADGLGVRYIGDQYLVVTDRMGEAWTQVEPQVTAMLEWAEVAWDQAKETLDEKLQSSDAGSAEDAT